MEGGREGEKEDGSEKEAEKDEQTDGRMDERTDGPGWTQQGRVGDRVGAGEGRSNSVRVGGKEEWREL